MARETSRKYRYGGGRVVGNLAYDLDYEERRAEREKRERRTVAIQRPAAPAAPRKAPQTQPVVRPRQRQRVSVAVLLGFAALAGLVVVLVMSYARLTEISANVVSMQSELSTAQQEHVALLTRYEKTFDLATVKQAAEAAGMSKPSASQVYYVDLSAPDNVVIYQQSGSNVLSRFFTSLGRSAASVVEYFK